MAGHTETDFEHAIEYGLINHDRYGKGDPAAFDPATALFPNDVISFIRESQPARWVQLEAMLKDRTAATVIECLTKELASKGTLGVLRHGFKCYGKELRLAYFQPNSGMNPESAAQYAANRLTITRQVAFTSQVLKRPDGTPRKCIIDVVLSVNGLPVVTVELKNPLTGQRAQDACKQYASDRDGRDLLFRFKERALVHFAVDPDEAWMTTELKGEETVFLPFNRGHNSGAGNPPVEGNWKTHYLWDEVLHADSLLDILQRFMHVDVTERTIDTPTGKRIVRREAMIFPRYHQLDVVRKLIGDARKQGPGHNYLIQHSAGSGKSNSIAWLAHRLASLHDATDAKVFDSVIVITDRRVLDQQLQNTVYQFEHKTGVVEKIDENTQQLAKALAGGTPIIISTIQKFPFISKAIRTLENKGEGVALDTAGKCFAVIVDEAHSSQSGETVAALKGILNKDGIADAIAAQLSEEEDDELSEETKAAILKEMMSRARQPNLSFFAFTATPKFKTKAVFDEPGPTGASPFHEYSMRQAIQEGFILDVLENYTTYKRFFGLVKQIVDDPEVPKKAAAKALGRFLELHPVNIEQVVQVIIEHFRLKVMHELGGRAKAMVVTGSRLSAVKYKQAFDHYIEDKGYTGIRALVAFSGTVEDPEQPGAAFTEVGMNDGLSERELPSRFAGEEYRVLIVAEKYQTGFDQPLLQTMYVVKRLAGVQAVQTLSRLNRTAPGKAHTFVLDFRNEEDEIFKAFKPYYETTPVGDNADPQKLNELHHKLLQPAIFTPQDVMDFAVVWFKARRDPSGQDHKLMNAILDRCVARFKEHAEVEREEFRGLLTVFRNLYGFLSQILPYFDEELERLYAFVRNFMPKLPPPGDGARFTLDDDVALKFFRLQQVSDGTIDLSLGEADPLKGPTDVGTWFESGGEGQINVIRWIKKKLETPGITEAYLVDPYLGSEALQRVILRQGNETIKLMVVVSPGGIDPDADEVDERASGDYIAKLVQKADHLSAELCGEVSILHLQRGDGSRPAFHDRYLSIVDQNGTPTVYLFSNSLSKAAGDWPFAICEFNRIEAWRIHAYILELVQGKSGNRKLDAKVIWTSKDSRQRTAEPATEQAPTQPESSEPQWVKAANTLLSSLQKPNRQVGLPGRITEQVKTFIEAFPEGTYVLIAIVKKELKLDASLYTCLQILSVSIFEKTEISCALQPYLHRTDQPTFANQLNLFDI